MRIFVNSFWSHTDIGQKLYVEVLLSYLPSRKLISIVLTCNVPLQLTFCNADFDKKKLKL